LSIDEESLKPGTKLKEYNKNQRINSDTNDNDGIYNIYNYKYIIEKKKKKNLYEN